MMRFQTDNKNAIKFANAITVTVNDLQVGLTLSMPATELVDMMNSSRENWRQKAASRRARRKASESQPGSK